MYQEQVKTQDEALSHLFFHCCMKDGSFKEPEINNISDKLVATGLHTNMNFKDEVKKYRSYQHEITDEEAYLEYLIFLIQPTNEMALYSWCMELCLSDGELSIPEEQLLKKIASHLKITEQEQTVTKKLMVQRKVVEMEKIF